MPLLQVGDIAPEFTGVAQSGKKISLSQFAGKKIILYFYPKDNTPGCTAEACNLRDNYQILVDMGFSIIGISGDNENSHQNFISKFRLPFPLIADTDKRICMMYGIWGPKNFMGRSYDGINRTTYIISESGVIEAVFDKVITGNHSQQIIDELKIK
ncbi:MAG: thioredoxin-dependent thiol peroxidase [Bacteroidota bacterium]